MGGGLSMHGYENRKTDFSANFFSSNIGTVSTGNTIANTLLGGAFGIFNAVLLGSLTSKSDKNNGTATPEQPQPSALELGKQTLGLAKIAVSQMEAKIEFLSNICSDEIIKEKEGQLEKLKAEVSSETKVTMKGADGNEQEISTKEYVQQYKKANDAYTNATKNTEGVQQKVTLAEGNVERCKSEFEALSALPDTETNADGEIIDNKKDKADAKSKYDVAEKALNIEKQNLLDAQRQENDALNALNQFKDLDKDGNYDPNGKNSKFSSDIAAKLKNISSLEKEISMMNNTKEANKKKLAEAQQALVGLLEKQSEAQTAYDQLVLEDKVSKGKTLKKKNSLGEAYTTKDAEDGTWLSRTWQKTKGIFSKSERAEYKEMKEAHKAKKEAGAALESMGVDTNQYSAKAQNNFNANRQTNKFIESFRNNTTITALQNIRSDITAYYEKNPNASDAQVKQKFGISDSQNGASIAYLQDIADKHLSKANITAKDINNTTKINTIKEEISKKTGVEPSRIIIGAKNDKLQVRLNI